MLKNSMRCVAFAALAGALLAAPAASAHNDGDRHGETVRFATYNASLNRANAGDLIAALESGTDPQIREVAETIQRTRPEVLLVNEFDYDPRAPGLFQRNYLSRSQNGARPIHFPHTFIAPSNTGMPTGKDLNNNGRTTDPDDAYGFGFFPGQFGMAVFSEHPIDRRGIRTFQHFKWKDMPGSLLPTGYYSPDEVAILRLSSKSHWDLPLKVRGKRIHFLTSHPTPPVFDGPEDRNGRRNHDEIRLSADYITPGRGGYIYDDQGRRGGLGHGESFVIAGDQNADPNDGDSTGDPAELLLQNPRVNTSETPESLGGPEQSAKQGPVNAAHTGNPAFDTADFSEPPGNLRADYVLPSRDLRIRSAFVFWPLESDPLFRLVDASDHRLTSVDVVAGGRHHHGH